MVWLMRLLRYILRALSPKFKILLLIVFCAACIKNNVANAHSYKKTRFCANRYITYTSHRICSIHPLKNSHLKVLSNQIAKSFKLFDDFAVQNDLGRPVYHLPLDIYIVPYRTLNNTSIFGSKFAHSHVVGRYYETKGYVFITNEYGLKPQSTDLAHELAHYANDNLGIVNESRDEMLARKFEQYYKRNTR